MHEFRRTYECCSHCALVLSIIFWLGIGIVCLGGPKRIQSLAIGSSARWPSWYLKYYAFAAWSAEWMKRPATFGICELLAFSLFPLVRFCCSSLPFGKGSTLKNYLRQRLSRRMCDAERHTLYSQLLCNFRRLTRYCQRGTSARLSHHFQIHPSHPAPPASS